MANFINPREDVAQDQVIAIQNAQTLIKETIIKSYREGWDKKELSKQLAIIIRDTVKDFNPADKENIKNSLAINAQKWDYIYRSGIQVTNANTMMAIQSLLQKKANVTLKDKTYNIDLNEYIGLPPKQQNEVITKFRNYITEDLQGAAIIDDYEKKVKSEIIRLSKDPANIYRTDKNGKPYKMSLRNYAEMRTRYEANLKDLAKYQQDEKVDLVWTSSHPDASHRCSPYQGKLYSISGKSGTIDGITYTPLQEALEGPRGDGNGIINGYNCRHRLIPYTPKSRAPQEYNQNQVRQENAITQRQRQYENNIRNMKLEERVLRANNNTREAKALRNRWQKLTNNYKEFSLKNQRPYYEWRTRVTKSEIDTI